MPELCILDVPPGASLEDLLFPYGIEFPCGGTSLCGGCRVRVIQGDVPVSENMRDVLTPQELADGWRLACEARAAGRVVLEIGQWNSPILSDEAAIASPEQEGFAIAVDLGTTTLVAQVVDLRSGEIHGVRTALNPQAAHGADVMSRVEFDLKNPGVLTSLIHSAIGAMVCDVAAGRPIREVLIAGNTVMHHLFCGFSVEPLSHVPFEPVNDGTCTFSPQQLGWPEPLRGPVTFAGCLGGFVGSDVLAGMIAVKLLDRQTPAALIDLGTNGEIAIGDSRGALCASTAAGPAFEAGRIRMGMRAAPGAIDRVAYRNGRLDCHVIAGEAPRGICGSGLVDAVAAALSQGSIGPSGRIGNATKQLPVCPPVFLTQADIRELQLAKGAVAAGFRVLLAQSHLFLSGIDEIFLAGAFGNYLNVASASRIGLLDVEPSRVTPAGNTALRGLKVLLGAGPRRDSLIESTRRRTRHVSLAADPLFLDEFTNCMPFSNSSAS